MFRAACQQLPRLLPPLGSDAAVANGVAMLPPSPGQSLHRRHRHHRVPSNHRVPSHRVPSHRVPSHRVPSHRVPSHPVPSNRCLLFRRLKYIHRQQKEVRGGGLTKWSYYVDWRKRASSSSLLCPAQPRRYRLRRLRHPALTRHRLPRRLWCRLHRHYSSWPHPRQARLRRPCS